MGKELIISASRHETKAAILEDDQLVETFFQRANEYSLAGSIHKGRVTRVLPGMQSAFVDIGLERDAFLYVSDFFEENEEYDRIPVVTEDRGGRAPRAETAPAPVPAAPSAPPPAPAARDRDEGQEGRDRRGRRPRRRPRGRGLPESKYAFEAPAVIARPEPAPTAEDFELLPGETLAKYRGPGDPDAPRAEEPVREAVDPALDPVEEEQFRPEPESPAEASLEAGEPAAENPPEPPAAEEPEEPVVQAHEVEAAGEEAQPEEPSQPEEPPQPSAEEVEPARMPISLTATGRGRRSPARGAVPARRATPALG